MSHTTYDSTKGNNAGRSPGVVPLSGLSSELHEA